MQRRKGNPKDKKNRGRMSLSVLAPSFNCAAKFLRFPAQSVARIFLPHFLGKRSPSLFLWKPVHPCAKTWLRLAAAFCASSSPSPPRLSGGALPEEALTKKSRAHEPFGSCALFQLSRKVFMLSGSIYREDIPAPFPWQEVSLFFPVETCAPLCKKLAPVLAPHFHTSVLECGRLVSRPRLKRKRTSVRKSVTTPAPVTTNQNFSASRQGPA